MKIEPRKGILLIRKFKKSQLKADIAVEESDEDKSLISGEILAGGSDEWRNGDTVIFGKYSIFTLVLQGEKYYFLDENDVIAGCDFKEK